MKMKDIDKVKVLGVFLLLAIGIGIISIVDVLTDEPLSDSDLHFDMPETFFYPHMMTREEFNDSGLDLYIGVKVNSSKSDVILKISIPSQHKTCFIDWLESNLPLWFGNVTLDCEPEYIEITDIKWNFR